ncbi:uncharacterized protein [Nicotiana tomentosiformis]|uniref:uncharacterized protein n=1 Tax=Nicotiana tomentosiformis TaxID=4098 RepID=UPI00388C9531
MSAPPENWEGQSTARPPLFNGQYYSWWKNRMRDHIIGEDYELWDIVTDDEYSRIQSFTTAKKIWDTLQVAHKGTPQVKRSIGTLLYSQYDNFTMKEGETIQEMYTRFTTLINGLKSLGRIICEEDRVEKILTRVLPVTWESKITTIQESKNITTLRLNELIGNLTAYELRRQTMKMDIHPKKNKGSTKAIVAAWGESSDEDYDDEDEDEDEQALMVIGEFDEESKKQLSNKCVILKAKCKNLELRVSETISKNIALKNQVHAFESNVLELRSENLKLKLETSKKTVDCTQLTLEENIGKLKDKLYKKDEQIQEHHSSNRRGIGFGNLPPKRDPKSKGAAKYGPWIVAAQSTWHMAGSKNRFLSVEDLKGGNVLFENGNKGEIIGVGKEHDDEAIGMVRNLNEITAQTKATLEEGTGSNFNLVGYADSDYAGFFVDRKITSSMAHFLGSCLVSWATKKQNSVALSTAEAEYIVVASSCAQLLWIKQQLKDFEIDVSCIPIFCDNTSAISMTKNPVRHKKTKHIDVRHHFLRDNYEKGLITVEFCTTDKQIADIFTKALSRDHFERNRLELGMIKII